ncbi:Protein mono-ADP-ribosyltransferase parp8 [Balamuthia mandrillaris]
MAGRRLLRQDVASVKEFYSQPGSLLRDLEWEGETLAFTFDCWDGKPVPFTLLCGDDYPGTCTLYSDTSEPKDFSGRLPAVIHQIVQEQCMRAGIEAPATGINMDELESKDKGKSKQANTRHDGEDDEPKQAMDEEEGEEDREEYGEEEEEEEEEAEDYYDEEEAEAIGFAAEETSPLLQKDIDLFIKKYGSRSFSKRDFTAIDTLEVELHLDASFLGESIAQAWGFDPFAPVIIRIGLSPSAYLSAVSPPKVEVFQNTKTKFRLGSQLTQIVQNFCKEQWNVKDKGLRSSRGGLPTASTKDKQVEAELIPPSEEPLEPGRDGDVANLLEMGFSLELAKNALRESSGGLEEALQNLLSSPERYTDKAVLSRRQQKRNHHQPKRGRFIPTDEEESASANPLADWEQNEMSAMADVRSCIPDRKQGFLVQVLEYLLNRIPTLSNYCVICDRPHVFAGGAMLKPAVCSRELCCFSFQQLGVMSDAADEIATQAEVVDLLICMATAAANSGRATDIFDPFPTLFDPDNPKKVILSPKDKNFSLLKKLLTSFPTVHNLSQAADCLSMKDQLDRVDRLAYPLLQWIISSNRSHIVKLSKSRHIPSMNTPYQYVLLSSPPEKEEKFRELKAQHGSVFAFHGSRVENWHCILRMGLKNASGTKLQLNGAAYGAGIYLSPHSTTSFGYSQMHGRGISRRGHSNNTASSSSGDSSSNRFLSTSNFYCIALCEVINHSSVRKSGSVWVCPEPDYVVTRFFFVYDQGLAYNTPNVQTDSSTFLAEIQHALGVVS